PPSRLRLTSSTSSPVLAGTLVSFHCISERVYPNPIFEWYKNDKLIQSSIGNQTDSLLFSSSSLLTLLLTPADHNNILRCQVSNEASVEETRIEVKLDILFKPLITFSFKDKELAANTLTVVENTSENIHCRTSSNPPLNSNIEWFKNDQLILGENQEQLPVKFHGIEKLSCRARNSIGQTEAYLDVNILYKPKLSMVENVTLNQNEKLVLKCSIDANPWCEQIRWLFNEQELVNEPCTDKKFTEYVIEKVDRSNAGKYICEVKNSLNTSSSNHFDGIAIASTDVRVQYEPFILNSYKKLAVVENHDVKTECIVDAYPKPDISWFDPSGQRLSSFTKEKVFNNTITIAELHLPLSYSSILGQYRCSGKNDFGQREFVINFQRPGLPDPPIGLQARNVTHSSFILDWQSGYDGGSEQLFYVSLDDNSTNERETLFNSLRFDDLNSNTRYSVKIRSKNDIGYSDYSSNVIITTKQTPVELEAFPNIQRAYFTPDGRRIRFQLSPLQSSMILLDQLCIQHYNAETIPPCIPLTSLEALKDGLELQVEAMGVRLKLCLINQTDVCSKFVTVPTTSQLLNDSSELILIITGSVFGLCIVLGLIVFFICVHRQRRRVKAKNGSTDTLKTTSENGVVNSSVRVNETNPRLYYPSQAVFYNDEHTGVYSLQQKPNSSCLDSGMPSTTSDNSDSAGSQVLSGSDFYERSDGEYLVNGRMSTNRMILSAYSFARERDQHVNIPIHERISSSEEESGFSTPTRLHNGKKLIYEVVV
ncbi:unnamed protein product, partial [Adineta ricciae]